MTETCLHSHRYQFDDYQGPLHATPVDLPPPSGAGALLRVAYCGVCHTDLHVHQGFYDLGGGKRLDFKERNINPPITMGHEVVGVVEQLGPEADPALLGRTCLIFPWIGCGACKACGRGAENICVAPRFLGVFAPGGYAEHVAVPDVRYLVDIEGLNASVAATLACSGLTTYSAIRKALPLAEGSWTAVIGCGGVGQSALQILKAMGEERVVAVDLSAEKRETALAAGAAVALDPAAADFQQRLAATVGGDLLTVFDFVGAEATAAIAVSGLAKGGRYIVVGLFGGEFRMPLPFLPTRSISVIGSYVGRLDELRDLVAFVRETRLPGVPVELRPLSEANEALADLEAGRVTGRLVLQGAAGA